MDHITKAIFEDDKNRGSKSMANYRWDLPKPTGATEGQTWDDGNDFILITIRKNREANARSRIGTHELAKNAYDELKKAYEGKTTAEFHALLDSLTNISFDDRKSTIKTKTLIRYSILGGIVGARM